MGTKQSKELSKPTFTKEDEYNDENSPPPPPPESEASESGIDGDDDDDDDGYSIVDVDAQSVTSSHRSHRSHQSSRRSSRHSSRHSSHRSTTTSTRRRKKKKHHHHHHGPLRRSQTPDDENTSLGSSYLEQDEDWLQEDAFFDHSCSDTDCSWASDDSDYTSMFSLYEEDLQPTKWMRRFEDWLNGGDEIFHSSQEENDEDSSEEEEEDEESTVMSSNLSVVLEVKEDDDGSKDLENASAFASKYAVFETKTETETKTTRLQIQDYDDQDEPYREEKDTDPDENNSLNDSSTDFNDLPPTRRRYPPEKPESIDLSGMFQNKNSRKLKKQLLPILSVEELETDMDDVSSIGSNDFPTLQIEPGSIPWTDLSQEAQENWERFGWNEIPWNAIIQEKKDAEQHALNVASFRKHERDLRREFRKTRRADRKIRRKIRDQRALRNKRGGGKLTAYQLEEEDPIKEDGERVEKLIRRIMKRAEKEEAIRKKLTEAEDARRKKAKQIALGMNVGGDDENAIKVKDMSLDLELRSRPWNSRSHADRSELLYQTLFRPFTKNV